MTGEQIQAELDSGRLEGNLATGLPDELSNAPAARAAKGITKLLNRRDSGVKATWRDPHKVVGNIILAALTQLPGPVASVLRLFDSTVLYTPLVSELVVRDAKKRALNAKRTDGAIERELALSQLDGFAKMYASSSRTRSDMDTKRKLSWVIGTILTAILMAQDGEDDKDKLIEITGAYPSIDESEEIKRWAAKNLKAYSMYIKMPNGSRLEVKYGRGAGQELSMALIAAKNIDDALNNPDVKLDKKGKEREGLSEAGSTSIAIAAGIFKDTVGAYFTPAGLAEILSGNASDKRTAQTAGYLAANFLPAAGAVRSLQHFTEPRMVTSSENAFFNSIPYYVLGNRREGRMVKYDNLGFEVNAGKTLAERFQKMGLPLNMILERDLSKATPAQRRMVKFTEKYGIYIRIGSNFSSFLRQSNGWSDENIADYIKTAEGINLYESWAINEHAKKKLFAENFVKQIDKMRPVAALHADAVRKDDYEMIRKSNTVLNKMVGSVKSKTSRVSNEKTGSTDNNSDSNKGVTKEVIEAARKFN